MSKTPEWVQSLWRFCPSAFWLGFCFLYILVVFLSLNIGLSVVLLTGTVDLPPACKAAAGKFVTSTSIAIPRVVHENELGAFDKGTNQQVFQLNDSVLIKIPIIQRALHEEIAVAQALNYAGQQPFYGVVDIRYDRNLHSGYPFLRGYAVGLVDGVSLHKFKLIYKNRISIEAQDANARLSTLRDQVVRETGLFDLSDRNAILRSNGDVTLIDGLYSRRQHVVDSKERHPLHDRMISEGFNPRRFSLDVLPFPTEP